MHTPVDHAVYGFRTRQSVLWMTSALLFAHLNLLLLRSSREGIHPAIVAGAIWLVVVLLTTTRTLGQLETLERDSPQPTTAMKLAFQLSVALPIVGTVPLFFPFFGAL